MKSIVIHCWVMAIWSFSHSDWTSDIRDRTCKWFYMLSNAAMQCTGQTKITIS